MTWPTLSVPRDDEIFAAAMVLPAGERAAYLESACAGDTTLREQIEALLEAHESARSFMQTPRAQMPRGAIDTAVGQRIGRYKLLQEIGEGGCGVVYLAEQEEPVVRRVALKLIKLGIDTKEVIARFEVERQALALMDHPNIARVLDAGATDTGRLFFVMEWVQGVRLTDYCDRNNATTRARLELFTQVCNAVQHAHQKGIIHRDLKPSNILVTLHDNVPMPKVIDFGIAKATHGRLTDATVFTALDQFIGTPAYMSPEQVEKGGLDIDTRSDIYSLGVLLYELLTACTPFDAKELLHGGLDEMRRRIREVEPPPPSTRLSTLQGDALSTTAQHRQVDGARLRKLLRGDLDWVVMRCLEKDRTRRYATVNALALDVQRYLHDEPVVARPPGMAYRAMKFARRHRFAVVAGAVTVALCLTGTALVLWQAVRATRAERAAGAARDLAEQRSAETRAINELLLSDALRSSAPEFALTRDIKVRDVLANADARITGAFAQNPLLEAAIRQTIGETYAKISVLDKAESQLQVALAMRRRLLGDEHPDTLASRRALGTLRVLQVRPDEGERLLQEVASVQRRTLGPDHEETLRTLDALFQALDLRLQSFSLPQEEMQPLLVAAEALARTSCAAARERFGPEHPVALQHLENLGFALYHVTRKDQRNPELLPGKKAELDTLSEQLVLLRRRVLGEEHPNTIAAIFLRVRAMGVLGRQDEGTRLLRQCIDLSERVMGPEHWTTAAYLRLLAFRLRRTDARADATPLMLRAARIFVKSFGWESEPAAQFVSELGHLSVEDGRAEDVAAFSAELLAEARRRLPAVSPMIRALTAVSGEAALARNRSSDAETWLRESLAIPDHDKPGAYGRYVVQGLLGGALLEQRNYPEAESNLLACWNGLKERDQLMLPWLRPQRWDVAENLVRLYTEWGASETAIEWQNTLAEMGARPGVVRLRSAGVQ